MYLNRIGNIWKRIKITYIFKKNYFFSYHGSFVINKNVKPEK